MSWFARRSETSQLSTQPFVLAIAQHRRAWLPVLLCVALIAALAYAAVFYAEARLLPAERIQVLEQENAALKASLDDARMGRELERATQAALENQVTELNREVLRLRDELKFFKKADGKP